MKSLKEVTDEFRQFSIESIDSEQLETVLQAHHGMNMNGFRDLLTTIIKRRECGFLKIHSLQPCPSSCCSLDQFCDEEQHRLTDIEAARNILDQLT